MSLYKYTSADNGIRIFSSGKIRFTQPAALNDPFEVYPCLEELFQRESFISVISNYFYNNKEEVEKEIQESALEIYASANPEEKKSLTFDQFKNEAADWVKGNWSTYINTICSDAAIKYLKQSVTDKTLKKLWNAVGILSLSWIDNDLLMWSHYADSHRGIILEFDEEHPFLTDNSQKKFCSSGNVEYVRDRPSIEITNPKYLNDGSILHHDVFYVKYELWKHEKEYRVIRGLKEANYTSNNKDNNGFAVFLFNFPPEMIKSVIFGCKIDYEKKNDIINLLSEKPEYKNVIIKQAKADTRQYKLEIEIDKR